MFRFVLILVFVFYWGMSKSTLIFDLEGWQYHKGLILDFISISRTWLIDDGYRWFQDIEYEYHLVITYHSLFSKLRLSKLNQLGTLKSHTAWSLVRQFYPSSPNCLVIYSSLFGLAKARLKLSQSRSLSLLSNHHHHHQLEDIWRKNRVIWPPPKKKSIPPLNQAEALKFSSVEIFRVLKF